MSDTLPAAFEAHEIQDYRIEIRVKNARILGMMRRAGIDTISELCRRIGQPSSMSRIGEFINLKRSPVDSKTGQYLRLVQRMADVLMCEPDDLFTERQRHSFMAHNRRAIEVSEAEVEAHLARLEQRTPEQIVDEHDFRVGVRRLLNEAGLTPQQRRVMTLRYPLSGKEGMTFDRIGELLGCSGVNVQQIEQKAVDKLRMVKNAHHVVPWLSRDQRKRLTKQSAVGRRVYGERP